MGHIGSMSTWERFNIGKEKADKEEFRGWSLFPASKLVELPPVEVDGPMTDERAMMLLDKIRHFEKHMRLRPLFNAREDRVGYAQIDRDYATALILEASPK